MPVLAKSGLSDRELSILNSEMAQKQKSVGIGYLLLIFLGGAGAHKFYLGKTGMGALYLGLTVLGAITTIIVIGWGILGIVGFMCLYDLFTLPRQVQKRNEEIETEVIGEIRRQGAAPRA